MSKTDERYLLKALEIESVLRAYLYHCTRNNFDVDELLQEVYSRLLVAGASGEPEVLSVRAFALTIARGVAFAWLRNRQVVPLKRVADLQTLEVLEEGQQNPEIVDSQQNLAILVDAIQGLPEPCRHVVTLRKVYGHSQKQIAARLSISEDAVEQHLIMAAQQCAQALFDQPVAQRRSNLFDRFRRARGLVSRASDISDVAADWLVRLERPASADFWGEFGKWMDHDPRHRAAFVRLRVAWHRVDRLKVLRPADGAADSDVLAKSRLSPATVRRVLQPAQGRSRRRLEELLIPDRRRVLATAAAIAATGVFAWFGAYHFGWRSYETGVGGREKIELSDGSTVDLNTNTELNARISGSRREIMLARGEAFFHVAHDSKRPFYVVAGDTVIRAVGTAFSVRIRDPEHVDVLVAEGRVAIGAPGTESDFENPALLTAAPKVSASQSATVRPNSVVVHALPSKDVTRKLAWTTGLLAFQGETLMDAVQEFNRYNQRQISIADTSILNVHVGGIFSTTDPDSFLAALQHSFGIHVQVSKDNGDFRLSAGDKPP